MKIPMYYFGSSTPEWLKDYFGKINLPFRTLLLRSYQLNNNIQLPKNLQSYNDSRFYWFSIFSSKQLPKCPASIKYRISPAYKVNFNTFPICLDINYPESVPLNRNHRDELEYQYDLEIWQIHDPQITFKFKYIFNSKQINLIFPLNDLINSKTIYKTNHKFINKFQSNNLPITRDLITFDNFPKLQFYFIDSALITPFIKQPLLPLQKPFNLIKRIMPDQYYLSFACLNSSRNISRRESFGERILYELELEIQQILKTGFLTFSNTNLALILFGSQELIIYKNHEKRFLLINFLIFEENYSGKRKKGHKLDQLSEQIDLSEIERDDDPIERDNEDEDQMKNNNEDTKRIKNVDNQDNENQTFKNNDLINVKSLLNQLKTNDIIISFKNKI